MTQIYVGYCNTVRPHQWLGNVPIPRHQLWMATGTEPPDIPVPGAGEGKIHKQEWLGGLLRHYYRQAA